ncbi:MAG: protein-disulfide reductase DsbD [Burkholderiales bacterium]|nr:protein-disulfide reductase DsbD [Burkholderiales bacterium]
MKRLFALAVASFLSLAAAAAGTDDLLAPEQAFKPSLVKKDDRTVVLHVDIADGYYLYRDRMHFSLQPGNGELKPAFPEGLVHHDDYFGDVMTYRHSVDVPLTAAAPIAPDVKVKVVTQGCADAGVCYPPQTVMLNASGSPAATSVSGKIAALFGDAPAATKSDPAPPNADAAKAPAATPKASPTATPVVAKEEKPAKASAKVEVTPATAPATPATPATAAAPTTPATTATPAASATLAAPAALDTSATAAAPVVPVAPTTPAAGPFDGLSGGALLIAFYLAGLGMAATVCMYPLIPIVSSLIVGAGGQASKQRGFVLSFAYVQGIGFVYAVVGAFAALSGSFLIAALQKPWVIGAMAGLFVLLALSMFGLFTLQLPSALQSKVNDASNRLNGGKLIPVFIMGALSSLIVGACMGPPLFAALSVVGTRADLFLGIVGFYLMAMGVGTPLVIVGVAGGHVLPKAGAWMTQVKNVFGVVMLAVALWIAHPVVPDWAFMLGWAALAIGAGVALSALDSLPAHAGPLHRVGKALGFGLVVFGAAQLIGLLAGSRDPLQPLRQLSVAQMGAAHEASLTFQTVASPAELDAALVKAKGRPVMLDFYADWCVSCREMEAQTFSDARVQQQLGKFILLKADVTANTAEQQALLKRFGLFGPPGTIFFGHDGRDNGRRLVGFEPADAFIKRLSA